MSTGRKFALQMEREYEHHITRMTLTIIKGEFESPNTKQVVKCYFVAIASH